jgi:uroporphyrinogen decarboxylase
LQPRSPFSRSAAFDFDAAILFSDILVIPDALGQEVQFTEGVGPTLEPLPEVLEALGASPVLAKLAPVLQTVRLVREQLSPDKALIGFCGAPWTVATYMVAGRGTPDRVPPAAWRSGTRQVPAADRGSVDASAEYLVAQLRAGADAVKIFDSWAGVLDESGFATWAVEPVRAIIERVRAAVPGAPVIAFSKGGRESHPGLCPHYGRDRGGCGLDGADGASAGACRRQYTAAGQPRPDAADRRRPRAR